MDIADGVDHGTRAGLLVRRLIDEHDPKYGIGSMTCSIYDTAWVSMVTKTTADGGHSKWLFPWSFHYLLGHQQHDGGWHSSSADVDGILNTLAALLALCKHMTTPFQLIYIPQEELKHKKDRAIYYLEAKFFMWDVAATEQKGFEILVPKLLQLLEQEGIEFTFPGRKLLMELKAKASAKYNPTLIYSNSRTILTQALEGFVGELDFDRVSHHKISGSMMASPASTAAYLMNCSTWDDEAEGYLKHVVSSGTDHSAGGVPSRYPTTVFEVTTALSVLLENGFTHETLGERHLQSAGAFLEDCLAIESGVTGFAPYVESDADNTSRAISTLCHLKKPVSPSGLLIRYETREHFKTYTQDRTPSFRTNCLVLKALLDLIPSNRDQVLQIEKCVKFIVNCWWTTNGQVEDTWNISPNYATMLMADALRRLVDLWEQGQVPILDDHILKDRVFVCLFQALTRTMQTQNRDGSWGHGSQRCETTAYATLILAKLSTFSSAPRIKLQVGQALEQGRRYLAKNFKPSSEADHVWNSKTTCGSSILFQAYVIAALHAPTRIPQPGHSLENHFEVPVAKIAIQTKYYSRQPWFANIPEWQIQAFLVESYLFLPQLKDVRFAVFPRDDLSEDRYFDSIPFAWIAASTVERRFIGAEFLYQMMILTFLNRQFEEYVKHVIGEKFAGTLSEIEEEIQSIYDELEQQQHGSKDECYCGDHGHTAASELIVTLSELQPVFYRFISHILHHPYILIASHHDQEQLRSELMFFLLGRIGQQMSHNKTVSSSAAIEDEALARTTGNTASDQTSHQYTFAFLSCLVGNQTLSSSNTSHLRHDFLETPEQQYLVADICRRLSILSFVTARAAQDDAPQAPYREAEPVPHSKSRSASFGDSDSRSVHSATSSVSATSSSYSDSSSPISPASSVSSAPSRSPDRDMFVKQPPTSAPAMGQPSPSPKQEHTQQLTRLLTHERKCLNICLESLAEAGAAQRTTNILKLFVDVSEVSEQIFHDPNVGSYQANIAHQIIQRASLTENNSSNNNNSRNAEQTCILDAPPVPPKRTDRASTGPGLAGKRGSVSAARAALEIAPLQPTKRDSVIPSVPAIPASAFESAATSAGAGAACAAAGGVGAVSMLRTQTQGSSSNRSQSSERTSSDRNRFSKMSFLTANETLSVPSQDDISIHQQSNNGSKSGEREWNFNKPAHNHQHHHRASRSSVEISRIQRIMADIEGGNSRNSTLPLHPALRRKTSEQFSSQQTPQIDPIRSATPTIPNGKTVVNHTRSHTISATTTAPRPYIPNTTTTISSTNMPDPFTFPKRNPTLKLDTQARRTSSGIISPSPSSKDTPTPTTPTTKSRRRLTPYLSRNESKLSRTESKMKSRARDAAIDRERKRASCLQAKAMAEAAAKGMESVPSRSATVKAANSNTSAGVGVKHEYGKLGRRAIISRTSTPTLSSSSTSSHGGGRVMTTGGPSGLVSPISIDISTANASVSTFNLDGVSSVGGSSGGGAGWAMSPPLLPMQSNAITAGSAGAGATGTGGAVSPIVEKTDEVRARRNSKLGPGGGPRWKAPF